MQVARWGNSLAVRIPADVVRQLGLAEGDDIELCALDGERVAVITEQQRRADALARLREFRGWMPADYTFDRDEANAR
ncbi:AbrB/MazE/SpoVT family DNA-binding domain-containing protein [Sphingomonas sp.]|uniref:AbrB/MazE/SpoVT family DNA-binding domain-containing protein n=1 Tax=Sphingomonas sp. TaxID=28214 RepID=UPI0035BC5C36